MPGGGRRGGGEKVLLIFDEASSKTGQQGKVKGSENGQFFIT